MSIGIGEALREARLEQGRTIEEAARETRVRGDYLKALEDERFEQIAGPVYTRGFIQSYARWLGLDPQPLLDRYQRELGGENLVAHRLASHPIATAPGGGPPPWAVWAAVSLALVGVTLGVASALGGRNPAPAEDPELTLAVTPTPTQTPTAPPPQERAPAPTPTPTTVKLAVLFEQRSWIRVRMGGQVVFQGTLEAGESRDFNDPELVELRFGNPGGVRLVLNGRDLGSPGAQGIPVTVACTPQTCSEADEESSA